MLLSALFLACATPPQPSPSEGVEPRLDLAPPWRLAHLEPEAVVLRLGDGADGVRITLAPDDQGRVVGTTPIRAGRTLEVHDAGLRWPLVAPAFPEHGLSAVEVRVEGVDLVVRLYGPPLHEVSADPAAPDDPVHTWVRYRPRGADWRVVVDGLATLSLPGDPLAVTQAPSGFEVQSAHGAHVFRPGAPRARSDWSLDRWSYSTAPSLDAREPYPRTALTWRPELSP